MANAAIAGGERDSRCTRVYIADLGRSFRRIVAANRNNTCIRIRITSLYFTREVNFVCGTWWCGGASEGTVSKCGWAQGD